MLPPNTLYQETNPPAAAEGGYCGRLEDLGNRKENDVGPGDGPGGPPQSCQPGGSSM